MRNVAQDPRIKRYSRNAAVDMAHYMQSDFFFLPMRHKHEFKNVATVMADHGLFLECAFPTMIRMMRKVRDDVTAKGVKLCTTWGDERGTTTMVDRCMAADEEFAVYHPVKVTDFGFENWNDLVDRIDH